MNGEWRKFLISQHKTIFIKVLCLKIHTFCDRMNESYFYLHFVYDYGMGKLATAAISLCCIQHVFI